MYGKPVLLLGLASQVLLGSELAMLDNHGKRTYQNLQNLHDKTPDCVVYFLGGCLPISAEIHVRQLSIFGMVLGLQSDPLNIHARNTLTDAKKSSKSWFCQIHDLCLQYNLPHPLEMLNNPPSKLQFKKMVKASVTNYWEIKLRGEASFLDSLQFFKPNFMSLGRPHPLWTTCRSDP